MRFAPSDPISLALAFHHREIWLYLGELRSVAQCKPLGGGEGSLAYSAFKEIATFWLQPKNNCTAFFRSIDDLYRTAHVPCVSVYYGTSTILNVEVSNYWISVFCHKLSCSLFMPSCGETTIFFSSSAEPQKSFGTFNWSKASNLTLRTADIMDILIGRTSGWLMLW